MKKIFLLAIITTIISHNLRAGWGNHVHINYLKESVSILDYFDYQMCISYKDDLMRGFIEGEIQFKYRANGHIPNWWNPLSNNDAFYLQGYTIDGTNIDSATNLFHKKLTSLQDDIINMRRSYSEVMFELGYILHSINNILLPLYEEGHYAEQQLASNTKNLELDNSNITVISELKPWLSKMLEEKITIRDKWSDYADNKDKEGFIKYADEANKKNIYTLSSILKWVIADCYGPSETTGIRDKIEKIHEDKMAKANGRKKWD